MPNLIWTPEALADVQRLYRFVASKDNNAAQRAVMAIHTGIRILAQRPHIGRPVDDMEPEFREWVIDFGNSANVALYHFDGQAAVLLAVRHQARPLASRKSLL